MITITIPLMPTIFALSSLAVFVFLVAEKGDGMIDVVISLGFPIIIFLMAHGLLSLLGAY